MKRAPPRANIGEIKLGKSNRLTQGGSGFMPEFAGHILESFAHFLTCFEKLCTILEEIGADEDKRDGCSRNAELGSSGSGIAGPRGSAAKTSWWIDSTASAGTACG